MQRAPYASDPAASRGREFTEEREGSRGPRSEFQRDRDRIVHSIAFRRLRSKTQVFIAPDGDHYRTRLTHSLEVAQIGRVLARELGLDEDLTEALCLGHDIGHPPFGHAGETALEEAMAHAGGYDHNAQGLRTLARLESPYCDHDGLNLTWETLEGLAKHNGPIFELGWALAEIDRAFPLDLHSWPSLEAQVAAIADDIAYDNHDIDDGLRAGFLDLDDLLALDWLADQWRAVERRFPHAPRDRQLRELVRTQIGLMANDLLMPTREQVKGMASVDDIRAAGRQLAAFSPEMREQERMLKRFMYERLIITRSSWRLPSARMMSSRSCLPPIMASPRRCPQNGWLHLPEAEPRRSRHRGFHRWHDRPLCHHPVRAHLRRDAGRAEQCLTRCGSHWSGPPVWSVRR